LILGKPKCKDTVPKFGKQIQNKSWFGANQMSTKHYELVLFDLHILNDNFRFSVFTDNAILIRPYLYDRW
jgi:hypothetical protein